MKNKSLLLAIVAISLFFIGSSWNNYRPLSLQTELSSFGEENGGVKITAKAYTSDESQAFLHQNLLNKGYAPVELVIHNNTANAYTLSAASVPLLCDRGNDVAWSITKKAIPRGVGLKVLGFLFWPFTIPSAIDTIVTYKKHQSLTKDLTAKTLKEQEEIVPPYASITRVLYVKSEGFRETFSVSLQDIESKELLVIPAHIPA
jgi:hypothetical protein